MKFAKRSSTKTFKNSSVCVAIEYPIADKDLNGSIIKLKGRYPDKGFVVNKKCKEMAYILKGSVKLTVEKTKVILSKGDLVLIEPKEKYFWDGDVTMFVPSTPPWRPEQHKNIKDG